MAAAVMVGSGLATASAQARTAGNPGHGTPGHHDPGTPAYTPPPITWGTCPTTSLQKAGAVCGMLTVPLDYAHPDGQKIQLAVSKIAHKTSDAAAQGPMLVNPGGPGGSGLGLARLGASVPHGGGDPYDWIGFDPRGVGRSIPSLSCDPSYFKAGRPSYNPVTPDIKTYWLDKAAGYAADCKEAGGALLDHDKTTDWVNDMESIRKALGASQINYYGFSYGTYLGQVYATLHPDRVRRFVFDGVVDPRQVWYEGNLAQEKQFDPNADTFFQWVADNDAAYGLGSDGKAVRKIYYDTLADLTAHPEADFGPADWNDVFVGAAYYVYDWDYYAHVLASAAKGDLAPAKEAYGAPGDATYATYMAVECTDAAWPRWKRQEHDADKIASSAPFLAWNNTWYNAPCLTWPAAPSKPVDVDGKGVSPILLIEETNDAATPWSGAIEVRKRFPKSALIEGVGGTTHAGSLSGVSCTDDAIATYLLTGVVPKRQPGNNRSDLKCDPVPPPAPTPVAAAATVAPAGSAVHDRLG
ncbi:alpha/beta hydrolase, partial [Nocardioides sp. CER28]